MSWIFKYCVKSVATLSLFSCKSFCTIQFFMLKSNERCYCLVKARSMFVAHFVNVVFSLT